MSLSALKLQQYERELPQHFWRDFGAQTTPYEASFPDLLAATGFTNFGDLLQHLKNDLGSAPLAVLDLGAPLSSFINRYPVIDQGFALTLAPETSSSANRITLAGDIFRRKLWRDLTHAMQTQQINHFHLILARPLGGLTDQVFPDLLAGFCHSLLERAYRLLAQGVLMAEMPALAGTPFDPQTYADRLVSQGWQVRLQPPNLTREYGYRYALLLAKGFTL